MTHKHSPGVAMACPSVESEAKYFTQCPECGDWFDLRDFRDAFIHGRWHDAGNKGLMPGRQRH
jgi:hypothetical protein